MHCAQEYGQDYFRTCESEVLKQLAPYKNLVVATGGGAVLKPMNWSCLHQVGGGLAPAELPLPLLHLARCLCVRACWGERR